MSSPNDSIPVQRTHFWVTSYPFCEAVLFLCPQQDESSAAPTAIVRLFDSDGEVVNDIEIALTLGTPVAMELDPLMERCKLESGLRHGHLMIEHSKDLRAVCRLQNRGGAVLSGSSHPVTADRAMFSPVTLSPDRCSIVSLVNYGAAEALVRVRLMLSNRSPDVLCAVPPFGARALCLEREFAEALTSGFGKSSAGKGDIDKPQVSADFPETRGYIRISMKNEQSVGVQLVESVDQGDQGTLFSALSW